ncbi:SRPBCC family protein [Leptospira sp. 201903070]|uniref:SRPBCC family protein n=1 Tax=Leptospira ainlahdjerensis TaxID=2810033 RepID=A0ABS2U663_9LEPT|nr:SRPBCC family protein [Leptospira ainlahdjerensis]MBM9575860.1 SRPBCC family protein [Leptospira ainlahdjerensis]
MNLSNHNKSNTKDREITASRVFDAPRELVWKVWTDPNHIGKWWGPNGFTNTIETMEVKPGGIWKLIMHGPDGTDYPNRIVYIEVVKPERLVYKHGSDLEDHPGDFHVTVTFEEENGKTRLTMLSLFQTAAARDEVVEKYGAIEGMNQTLDRLRNYLTKIAN